MFVSRGCFWENEIKWGNFAHKFCHCACDCYICSNALLLLFFFFFLVFFSSLNKYLGIFLRSAFLLNGFGVNQISRSFSTPSKYWGLLILSFSAMIVTIVVFFIYIIFHYIICFVWVFDFERWKFVLFISLVLIYN